MQRESGTNPHGGSPDFMVDHLPGVGGHASHDRAWRGRGRDRRDRIDWPSLKGRIELREVARDLLGEPPKVGGSGREWWVCPFHPDRNPSFCVTPGFSWWRCFGCDARGDAATLVMKLEGVAFPEAVRRLASRVAGGISSPPRRPTPAAAPPRPRASPTGLPIAEAMAMVEASRERLWSPEGHEPLRWLRLRGLTDATIRDAGLGWTPGVMIPSRGDDPRSFLARGIAIPWLDGERLALVKVRQTMGRQPKYVEAFRDRPRVYPSLSMVRAGAPLILVEGEFDALLLGQELAGLAAVVTSGSASSAHDGLAWDLCGAAPIFAAHDADEAGDRAASRWPSRTIRVRPPAPDKDWTEAAQSGVDLRRWWSDRIGAEPATHPGEISS
ncbi:MAG: CHC2 zinc finger domain-containing protein [Isosphaeraceae bacterium]